MMKNYVVLFFFALFLSFPAISIAQQTPQAPQDQDIDLRSELTQENLDNFKLNESVTMYPNPVQNYLTIQSSFPITRVKVFSLLGQMVKDVKSNFNRIYLGELNSGIYMIKIYSNEYHITKKLVKR